MHLVDEVQRPEGYRLWGLFVESSPVASAVAGFRVCHSLSWGRFLYIDDLSTHPAARRRGYGRRLLDSLLEEGRRLGCAQLHLDSGVGLDRADAHRLYLGAGLVISAHHSLDSSTPLLPRGTSTLPERAWGVRRALMRDATTHLPRPRAPLPVTAYPP